MALLIDGQPWKLCSYGCVHHKHCPFAHDYDATLFKKAKVIVYHVKEANCQCPGCKLHGHACLCQACGVLKQRPPVNAGNYLEAAPTDSPTPTRPPQQILILLAFLAVIGTIVLPGVTFIGGMFSVSVWILRRQDRAAWKQRMCRLAKCAHDQNRPCHASRMELIKHEKERAAKKADAKAARQAARKEAAPAT